jgi:hypothetical protein
MPDDKTHAIVQKLVAEDSPLRKEGISLAIEFLLSRRVNDLVDLKETRDIVLRSLTEDNLRRIMARHVKPGWRRYSTLALAAKDTVGALVPDDARRGIRDTVSSSRLPKAAWAQGAVDPALVRKLFAPVFTNVLMAFAKKLPLPGAAGAAAEASQNVGREVGTIASRLTRTVQKRAEKLVDAGRTVMGGIGAEMEKRFQASAREFSEGAVGLWREALRERLQSDEGRELMRQISQQATDHVMMTPIAEIQKDAERLPIDAILDLTPAIVAHASAGVFVRRIVDEEIRAFLEAEGDHTLGELLDELGVADPTRAAVERRFDALARELFVSEAFAAWVTRLIE